VIVKRIVIIGGGLAGLISAFQLRRAGFEVILFEEKKYPFHKVCGEYISNEVIPYLKSINLFPAHLNPSDISQFKLTSTNGNELAMPLDLGGFGISRYAYDTWLAERCEKEGVEIIHDRVTSCEFDEDKFLVKTRSSETLSCELAIGAFGKRSWLDKELNRQFMTRKSPYVGVKYHIRTNEVPENDIQLHNFEGGYCGVSKVEGDVYNMCYLTHRRNFKTSSEIRTMEEQMLFKNPKLKCLFQNSEFLFDKPFVINEITFEKKEPVFNHILMTGDSAGMITPLCGNGMAIAIHSAKILSDLIIKFWKSDLDRNSLENAYQIEWNKKFRTRLWAGRNIQRLFGATNSSGLAVKLGKTYLPFASFLMKQTHGKPF